MLCSVRRELAVKVMVLVVPGEVDDGTLNSTSTSTKPMEAIVDLMTKSKDKGLNSISYQMHGNLTVF